MSGIEAVGLVLAVIPTITGVYRVAFRDRLSDVTRKYRQKRFNVLVRALSWVSLFDTDAVQELQMNINTWTDDEIIAWKMSYIDSCNAISVAGAIFASIGLIALADPNIPNMQWSARALLTVSTVFGILSVVSATSQHRHIGLLNKPLSLRFWLSRGRVPKEHRTGGDFAYPPPYDTFVLDSSVSAMLITQFPRVLLNIAVFLYLIGFGLFTLFSWLEHVPDLDVHHSYRNIFIVFIVTIGASAAYLAGCGFWKILDDKQLGDDFDFQRLGKEVPYDSELAQLGDKARKASVNVENVQLDLVQAIKALTTEVDRLRKAMKLNQE